MHKLEDGWTTDSSKRAKAYSFATSQSAPRPFGFLDQLGVDLRSVSGLVYAALVAMLVAGISQRQLPMILVPVAAFLFLGRTMWELVQLNRDGVLLTLRATSPPTESNKVPVQMTIGGQVKTIDVSFPAVVAKEMIARHGAIEILALVNLETIEKPRAVNHRWLAFRPAAQESAVPTHRADESP